MRFGILVFPGTWSETDCYYQVKDILGQDAEYVWHDETNLDGVDSVILGVKNRTELAECVAAANATPLSAGEMQRIDGDLSSRQRLPKL